MKTMAERSKRSRLLAWESRHESRAAAARSRRSRHRSAPAIRTWRGFAWRSPTGRPNSVDCEGTAAAASTFSVDKRGGFARLLRETPCATLVGNRRCHYSMTVIDRTGMRAVCCSCHKLGPYQAHVPAAFVCAECVRAAEAHIRRLAEDMPELRDHRLRRWRFSCDCTRCRSRALRAV